MLVNSEEEHSAAVRPNSILHQRRNENNDISTRLEWTWCEDRNTAFLRLLNEGRDAMFHENVSNGTAVAKGTLPLKDDQFFWEVEFTSPTYGTSLMIGIALGEADLSQVREKYCHFLGNDDNSCGLSYKGYFHHNGEKSPYCNPFTQGTVIGLHLDLWNGTLAFYKNKKFKGIACHNLHGKIVYPVGISTAARSSMRILRSCSFPSSLQFLCCAALRKIIPPKYHVLEVLDIPPGLQRSLEKKLDWLFCPLTR